MSYRLPRDAESRSIERAVKDAGATFVKGVTHGNIWRLTNGETILAATSMKSGGRARANFLARLKRGLAAV